MICPACGRVTDSFDIGFYRKMVNRGATECLCRACLAKEIGLTAEDVERLIGRFRRQGCALFPPEKF